MLSNLSSWLTACRMGHFWHLSSDCTTFPHEYQQIAKLYSYHLRGACKAAKYWCRERIRKSHWRRRKIQAWLTCTRRNNKDEPLGQEVAQISQGVKYRARKRKKNKKTMKFLLSAHAKDWCCQRKDWRLRRNWKRTNWKEWYKGIFQEVFGTLSKKWKHTVSSVEEFKYYPIL